MKKVAVYILSVTILFVVADAACGYGMRALIQRRGLKGDCHAIDYTIRKSDEDIIILGSSVGLNALDPVTLSDSLGMSCYNASSNGQGLAFMATMLNCILSRYAPRMVILAFTPGQAGDKGIGDRYRILAPYYHMGWHYLDSCMESPHPAEKYLLNSTFYRFNKIWWRMLLYEIVTPNIPGRQGFIAKPIPSVFPVLKEVDSAGAKATDESIATLRHMFGECREKGVKCAVVFPPQFCRYRQEPATVTAVEEICREFGFLCLKDYNEPDFLSNPELFYDNVHLNLNGAAAYSPRFVRHYRNAMNPQP